MFCRLSRLAALRSAAEGGRDLSSPQLSLLEASIPDDAMAQRLAEWEVRGFRCLTPDQADYPARLLGRPNSPHFLFAQGDYRPADLILSVAIVGTRQASEEGRRRARKLARALTEQGVTVVSGLATGIDRAAHEGALAAAGGRTLAVVGTGLETVYPPENLPLAQRIVSHGGILSQFWPDFPGQRGGANFLARNRTMADLTLGTVVVEASLRSGARSQAVHAQKTGGLVFLLRSLLRSESWAQQMMEKPGCYAVDKVEDVLSRLDSLEHSTGNPATGATP